MKKLISVILLIGVLFSYGMTVFAGSVPEDLLHEDKALVFFGKVVSYNADEGITVLPTQKIKGDVEVDTELTYKDTTRFGGFTPKAGKTYLMAYYDENNPLYMFSITSTDIKTLKIVDNSGGGMEDRMQKYLNDGSFEQKENERLVKVNAQAPAPTSTPAPQEPTNTKNYYLYGIAGIVVLAALIFIVKKRK